MNLIPPIVYPESDGKPMSDNTRQFRWIQTLAANIAALFHDRADVFVCGNQNWYPVEGHPEIVAAARVAELSRRVLRGQATSDEAAELQRLLDAESPA